MQMLHWKVRLAVLWVALAVGMSAHMLLALAEPGFIEGLIEGRVEDVEITTGFLIFAAVFWVVPLLMAFLSFALRDPANRYVNGGVGFVIAAMWSIDLIPSLIDGFSGMTLVLAAMVAAGLAIVWHAWRWPEARAEQPVSEGRTLISAGR